MLQAKPISPANGRPISDPAREDALPSAPAMIEESASRTAPPPAPGMGGRTAPAPPSQRLDGGAGAVGPLRGVQAGVGSASDREAGAEVEKEVGSWRGRLTARDRELVGHLGLVRYLRTNQIAEMMFRGRAQSVLSARLGELADRKGRAGGSKGEQQSAGEEALVRERRGQAGVGLGVDAFWVCAGRGGAGAATESASA